MLLAVDTAGSNCAVALARSRPAGAAIVARAEERIGIGHAERLMPMIGAVLAEAGSGYAELDRIAVTVGPGSFTGVRVGVAAARGLALALDIPAVGIGTLEALAFAAPEGEAAGSVIAVNDARRGEAYALGIDVATGAELVPLCVTAVERLAERARKLPTPLLLTGSSAEALSRLLRDRPFRIVATTEAPDIAVVAELALAGRGRRPPSPAYVRGADAKPQADKALARA
jgi:tRNA threonylcarbamoyladenosine biosynthesis protein TsaB